MQHPLAYLNPPVGIVLYSTRLQIAGKICTDSICRKNSLKTVKIHRKLPESAKIHSKNIQNDDQKQSSAKCCTILSLFLGCLNLVPDMNYQS